MKAFVTGVGGQLGYDVVNELKKRGYTAIGSDILDETAADCEYIKLDITDAAAVEQTIAAVKPDVVIHCAAWTAVDAAEDEENQPKVKAINVDGTQNIANVCKKLDCKMIYIGASVLMDACREYGARFHQTSTDEVYGDLPLDSNAVFTEESLLKSSSPYSSSKASADLLVLAYQRTYGLPVTISRCSNNYGPYQFHEKLIPLMILNAIENKPLPVYGQGLNVRDWMYVEDHCKAIDMILHHGKIGEVYNIGGHNEMRNIDIVKMICREIGKSESLIELVDDRKGHDLRYAIDNSKIQTTLGWQPEVRFEDGIQRTIRWYLENRVWWETVQ